MIAGAVTDRVSRTCQFIINRPRSSGSRSGPARRAPARRLAGRRGLPAESLAQARAAGVTSESRVMTIPAESDSEPSHSAALALRLAPVTQPGPESP